MKILLVNNGTIHLEKIKSSFAGSSIEVQRYTPDLLFNYQDKDLIILSGGGSEGEEIDDKHDGNQLWYQNEINLVLKCQKPLLGICMGFEVIAKAFGAVLDYVDCYYEKFMIVQTTTTGAALFGRQQLNQYQAHNMGIKKAPKGFEVLATSKDGIEIIRHKTRPIIATQFHPEVDGGSIQLQKLLSSIA